MNPIKILLLFISLMLSVSIYAEIVTLSSEQEVNVEEYGSASSDKHVIWLASERGISGELQKTVLAISKEQNLHILMPDWHDSYLLSPTRLSLEQIPAQDYQDLITYYAKRYKQLFLVAESRAATFALKTSHQLQLDKINSIAGSC